MATRPTTVVIDDSSSFENDFESEMAEHDPDAGQARDATEPQEFNASNGTKSLTKKKLPRIQMMNELRNYYERISNGDVGKLNPTLSRWNRHSCDLSTVAYLLTGRYENEGHSFDHLVEEDRDLVSILKKACEENNFDIYLANVETGNDSSADSCYGRVDTNDALDEIIVKHIVDLKGYQLCEKIDGLDFGEDEIVQKDYLHGRQENDRDDARNYSSAWSVYQSRVRSYLFSFESLSLSSSRWL